MNIQQQMINAVEQMGTPPTSKSIKNTPLTRLVAANCHRIVEIRRGVNGISKFNMLTKNGEVIATIHEATTSKFEHIFGGSMPPPIIYKEKNNAIT